MDSGADEGCFRHFVVDFLNWKPRGNPELTFRGFDNGNEGGIVSRRVVVIDVSCAKRLHRTRPNADAAVLGSTAQFIRKTSETYTFTRRIQMSIRVLTAGALAVLLVVSTGTLSRADCDDDDACCTPCCSPCGHHQHHQRHHACATSCSPCATACTSCSPAPTCCSAKPACCTSACGSSCAPCSSCGSAGYAPAPQGAEGGAVEEAPEPPPEPSAEAPKPEPKA